MRSILNKILFISLSFLFLSELSFAQKGNKVNWVTFEEAVELQKKDPKKIMIDVYTDWCGWCKKMESTTFTDPVIVNYINANYYPVKLNAEMSDTITFKGQKFVNPNPGKGRSTHQLAATLLNNKMSYPSTVFLDENVNLLSPVQGYLSAKDLEPMLKFYGENQHQKTSWDNYIKSFSGEVKK